MISKAIDAAIIGAGPYGLSLAAHLRNRGVQFRIFGSPMQFWRDLPRGINLKSVAASTNISVPEKGNTYSQWCRQRGLEDFEPCTMESFADYGAWMQQRFVPEVEPVNVTNVSRAESGFELTLANDASLMARHVVIATGLANLAVTPPVISNLPSGVCEHTSGISDYAGYRTQRVAVIGAGSSAIEAAALVHEAGGFPQVFVREPNVVFHTRDPRVRPLQERLRRPASALGNDRRAFVMSNLPYSAYLSPDSIRLRLLQGFLAASAPWWIKDRVVGKVPIHLQSSVTAARPEGNRVQLTIRSADHGEQELEFDRIIAGTGYNRDVRRLTFLDAKLRDQLRTFELAPRLSMNFESSVQGLYFVGPLSELCFGPLTRFVAGAGFTAKTLSHHLARQSPKKPSFMSLPQREFVDAD